MSKNLTYIKGNLFSAPKGSVLIHACNTQGSWGAGVAAAFASKFPIQRKLYADHCALLGKLALGTCLILRANDYQIACLFTSEHYGAQKDAPDTILEHTHSAVRDLLSQVKDTDTLAMPKINSGLFAVPWDATAKVLGEFNREFLIYVP